MHVIVPIIVVVIILAQIYFFYKNIKRMDEYKRIFEKKDSWGINHNNETGFVSGIRGKGNTIFESIKDSINKYLGNNSGSVIDFQLLKDAVDRHCDSVENDVNTLTPIPLYCGLAGTMAGVIVGLTSLLYTGSITALLSSGSGDFGAAANGVNDLLSGVAWAMLASICGIIFTTWGAILFKSRKIQGEAGKNTFLAWLQAKLLPELPSDTSDALNRLVKNLNKFNNTFAGNTNNLRDALREVNQSYRIQADIIQAVHDMDVMKMAKANVKVLEELKGCTEKLEQFNAYLDDIHGYTDAIHTFTSQFEREANRLHVLEEIQQYFMRHKAEIAKDSADVDKALRDAVNTLKEHASDDSAELKKTLEKQAEEFKKIIQQERDTFEEINKDITTKFSAEITHFPQLEKKLSEISVIPSKLDKLIERMEISNTTLASRVSETMKQTSSGLMGLSSGSNISSTIGGRFPLWMKWTIVASAVIIAATCITNTIHGFSKPDNISSTDQVDSFFVDTTVVETANSDSTYASSVIPTKQADSAVIGISPSTIKAADKKNQQEAIH
jgi:hypothetical protein